MEGILAFGGMGMLFISLIAIVCGIGIGVYILLTNTSSVVKRQNIIQFFKIILLVGVLTLLVGTGMCTLQSIYYPIHLQ